MFFISKNSFFLGGGGRRLEEGQKSGVRIGKGCMYIKGWLKPFFPSRGLGLRQLQVLIPVVYFALPPRPSDITRVTPVGNGARGGVVVKALRY